MTHYICNGGCNGVSDKPGTCQAVDCAKYQYPLDICNCVDGKHQEVDKEEQQKKRNSL